MRSKISGISRMSRDLPFAALLVFCLLNAVLIGQILLAPNLGSRIAWLAIIWAVGLSVYIEKTHTGSWPLSGLTVLGLTVLGLGLSYWLLSVLPTQGFLPRLLAVALIVVGALFQLPVCYYLGQVIKSKRRDAVAISPSRDHSSALALSSIEALALWGALAIAICSFLVIAAYSRTDVLGWDTPTYVFRARLLEKYGLAMHAEIGGGYQITFPLLCVAAHRLTGLDYIDIVRLLPPVLLTLTCLAAGRLAYVLVRSQPVAMLTTLFTLAWGLSPHLIVDARDNLAAAFFGILSLICLARSRSRHARLYELSQGVLLVLAGISHLAMSSIFLITTLHVNMMDFYEVYWQGERKHFLRRSWEAIRVPLVSGLVVGAIWLPVLPAFISSLGVGLRTMAELGGARDSTFSWVIDRYNLTSDLPWIVLGLAGITWPIYTAKPSRELKIVYAWSLCCILTGILLKPVSFLYFRFLMMGPSFLLIPLGIARLWKTTQSWARWRQVGSRAGLAIVVLGMLLTANLSFNTKKLVEIPGLPIADYARLKYVNQYIESRHPSPPFVFLAEDTGPFADSYSDLWRRTARSVLPDEALIHTYVYFGTLDYLLNREPTPPSAEGLPELKYPTTFAASSQRWWDDLTANGVMKNLQMTVFIVEAYNKDTFDSYLFLPMVDKVGPGILVVNVPGDL